uniref:Uncharacterized protein n=1 Tax=Chromera velia CCMP2878 TaxID=1169474 RepID=A0A0G4H2T4_9ALVE|eukprot:Cvel_5608.t1-p1 / transcript=Cvel_5608.t1 / gene=Cvel_5608 / organism=Chromera_velia_CCMP2878 / gene_product=hypothetical protein / transcript_product=hypothetical protein / location=Cvel_scaffold264:28388-28942(+) / protein_length=185 / sequence_SO=supercontig / SO=protein_coding / is_pseudo=false
MKRANKKRQQQRALELQQQQMQQQQQGQPELFNGAPYCYCGTVEYLEIGPVSFLLPPVQWVETDEEANVELRPAPEFLEQLKKENDQNTWWNAEEGGFIVTTKPITLTKGEEGIPMMMNKNKFAEVAKVQLKPEQAAAPTTEAEAEGEAEETQEAEAASEEALAQEAVAEVAEESANREEGGADA